MKQLVEFFDALLLAAGSYPMTIGYVIFAPRKLVDKDNNIIICPASLAIIISVFLYWVSKRLSDEMIYPGIIQKVGIASFSTLAITLTGVAISVMLLRFAVRNLSRLSIDDKDPIEELRLLCYPVCVGLLTYAVITVIAVNFPNEAIKLEPLLDSAATELRSTLPRHIQIKGAIDDIPAFFVLIFGAWSLFNIIRVTYKTKLLRSLLATLFSLLVVGAAVILVVFSIIHTGDVIKDFHTDYGLELHSE